MKNRHMASFVVRFQSVFEKRGDGKKEWRIKVTYVQEDQETLFDSIEEAMEYMKGIVGNSPL